MRLLAPGHIRRFARFETIGNARLSAPWVAYSWEAQGVDTKLAGVIVVNPRTGGVLRSEDALPSGSAWISVSALALKANGSIGWIAEGSDRPLFVRETRWLMVDLGSRWSTPIGLLDLRDVQRHAG